MIAVIKTIPRLCAALTLLLLPGVATAQTSETSRVFDGSGLVSSNFLFQTVTAVGQPHATGMTTTDQGILNYSGFLNTFTLHTNLDADADGVIDENDWDDDNDTLSDFDELTGLAFDPVTATDPFQPDSDADGASDAHEAGAGTNPWDPDSLFRIEEIRLEANQVVLIWKSREGLTYEVHRGTNDTSITTAPDMVNTVVGGTGTGPWKETLSGSTNAIIKRAEWYRIELIP